MSDLAEFRNRDKSADVPKRETVALPPKDKPKPEVKVKAVKVPETAATSMQKIGAVLQDIYKSAEEMSNAETDKQLDAAIVSLGKLCSRCTSLRENHLARWNEDGRAKEQPIADPTS
jgi:hypothetical protein